MIALIFAIIIICIVLGIVGFVVHGLFWLFIIGCLLFLATILAAVFRRGRRSAQRPR